MSQFHRFCAVIPLFLLLVVLAGCTGSTFPPGPWTSQPTASQTYENTPVVGPGPAQHATLATTPGHPSSLKVAILLPLSGQQSAVGQSMLQAAQLAVFDIGNDNLELISKDTAGTPGGAAAAASAAINEGAQLILGPLFAEEVRAVKNVTASRGINVLAFSTDWTLAGDNIFIMGFTPFAQVERIAQYAAAKKFKATAVAAPSDTYGSSTSRAFESEAQKYGLNISRALSDPAAYDSVFIPAGGQALAQTLQRVTNPSAQKLGTGLWDDPRIAANPQMNSAIFAAPSPSARSGFEQRYQSTYGAAPVRIASLAYDATALAAALANTGFSASALKNPSGFAGVDGIMRFQGNGLMERGMAILQISNGRIVEIEAAPKSFR